MRKHQFVKADCNCPRRATYFTCRHCGDVEYGSREEIRRLSAHQATCTSPDAPEASPAETFKSRMGGTFDCLAPDWDTWDSGAPADDEPRTAQSASR